MKINADLSESVVVAIDELPWVPSPAPGVERRMLDRDGAEVARATSVVRYAAGSAFDTHEHGAGEEFLVLEGVFEDEHGAYPPGTYVRNPWGTRHAPSSKEGCTIFVKLRQMAAEDQRQFSVETADIELTPTEDPTVRAAALHRYGAEIVDIEAWSEGADLSRTYAGGAEILVLEGAIEDARGTHGPNTWLRLAAGTEHRARAPRGARLWIKRGHLGG